jgi:polysaccharide deacetylase family protein (PEP-CTERM system associated)
MTKAAARTPNFLTFDIEEWFHANYAGIDSEQFADQETNLERLVDELIELCARHSVRTTCFVLGTVGQRSPAVVKKLHRAGHEIASHGHSHTTVYSMTAASFKADLVLSCDILEQITGTKVLGFRAPSFSLREDTLDWYYPVLEEAGLQYSSSVFPGKTFLYGISSFPEHIHRPEVHGRPTSILEFPMPVVRFMGKEMGLYIRLFSAGMLQKRLARENASGKPVILYVHPREIDPFQPRLPLPFIQSVVHYWGIKNCKRKLDTLMSMLPEGFGRICDALPQWSR